MSKTIGFTDALTEQGWKAGICMEAELATFTSVFEGEDEENAFVRQDRGTDRGDTLTIRFGEINESSEEYEEQHTETSQILGNEGSSTELEDSLQIRYYSYSAGITNLPVTQNMVSFNKKQKERSRLARQWGYRFEKNRLYQCAGAVQHNTTNLELAGGNTITEQDAASIIRVGDRANDGAMTTADVLTPDVIDELTMKATSKAFRRWPIVKCNTPWGKKYVLVVHTIGMRQLRTFGDPSSYYDLAKAQIQGGQDIKSNMLTNNGGFIYGDTVVVKSDFIPRGHVAGTEQASTRRAVFLGAEAAYCLFGEGYHGGPTERLGYTEHQVHRTWSAQSDCLHGVKRSIVDGQSWGCMAVTHYSHADDS